MGIKDIELAIDSRHFKKEVIIKHEALKISALKPEDNLENCFAITDGNDLVRLSDVKICPYLRGVCKKSRCMSWEDNHCSIFNNHGSSIMRVGAQEGEGDRITRYPISAPSLPSPITTKRR